MTCPVSRSRAFLLHKFAADVGDLQSKMALAYSYFRQEKRWWKSECWTDCYTVILCTTVWIFWKGLGHGLLYEITEGHASIKNQKIPEMRWHFICELNLICSFYSQKVVVNLLHPLAGSNWTNVVFSTVPYPKNLTISSTWLSILRSSFMSLVVRQSTFHLTRSLFGNSSSFEVLKFPIYKVQDRTDELKDQMKTTLLINSNEVLWVMVPRPVAPALTHKEASSRIRATSCGMDGEAPSNTPELRCFQIIHAVSRVAVARPLRRGLGVIRFAASHQWLSDASLSGGLQGIWSQESTSNQICFEKGQVRSR